MAPLRPFYPGYSEGGTDETLSAQLEILDTAGAEQFIALNETYIKVRALVSLIPSVLLFDQHTPSRLSQAAVSFSYSG